MVKITMDKIIKINVLGSTLLYGSSVSPKIGADCRFTDPFNLAGALVKCTSDVLGNRFEVIRGQLRCL